MDDRKIRAIQRKFREIDEPASTWEEIAEAHSRVSSDETPPDYCEALYALCATRTRLDRALEQVAQYERSLLEMERDVSYLRDTTRSQLGRANVRIEELTGMVETALYTAMMRGHRGIA